MANISIFSRPQEVKTKVTVNEVTIRKVQRTKPVAVKPARRSMGHHLNCVTFHKDFILPWKNTERLASFNIVM